MNLYQAYANNCGLKLSETPPEFPTNYFPAPQKYIVLHAGAGHPSRVYDHWGVALELIRPHLGDTQVVQIGAAEDPHIQGTVDLRGKNSIRQAGWVVENARAALCSDSMWAHFAGIKDVPLVSLYSVNPASAARPHYHNKEKTVFLESHRNGEKPSYDVPEKSKSINLIKPEEIARAALQVMGIDGKINIETKKIGTDFNATQIDLIPDFPIPPDAFNGKRIVCRLDLSYNLSALMHCLEFYNVALVTNKTVPLKVLQKYKGRINFIAIILEKGYSKTFVEQVHKLGVPYQIFSELTGRELSDARLELFDCNPIFAKKQFDKTGISEYDSYMTQRVFLSQNKFFPSIYHWRAGQAFGGEPQVIGDAFHDPEFWETAESCWFYKKEEEILHFK